MVGSIWSVGTPRIELNAVFMMILALKMIVAMEVNPEQLWIVGRNMLDSLENSLGIA